MSRSILLILLLVAAACQSGPAPGPATPPLSYTPPEIDTGRVLGPLRQEIVINRVPVPEGGAPKHPGVIQENGLMALAGTVDWEAGTYSAPGAIKVLESGRLAWEKAARGARTHALGHVVKLAGALRLDEARLLEVRTGEIGLEAHVSGAEIEIIEQRETNWCLATAKVPLTGVGGLTARVIATERGSYQRTAEAYVPKERCALNGEVTDVLVDARDSRIEPAFLPKIRTEDGRIVYDLQSVGPGKDEAGIVSYAVSDQPLSQLLRPRRLALGGRQVAVLAQLDAPIVWLAQRREARVVRPVVVKNLDQAQQVDVVVSESDAAKIVASEEQSGVLKNARVIVVVGSQVAGKRGRLPGLDEAFAAR